MFLKTFFAILLFACSSIFAQERTEETLVEDTPLELFSDRAQGWNYETYRKTTSSDNSLYETLTKVPGVFTEGETSGGGRSIRIRGANSVSRNLILLDGTPLNTADGTGPSPLLLPMEIVDSVDIMKGPSSTFYGAQAIGGAINLKPKKFNRNTVRLGYESFDDFSSLEKPSFFGATPIIHSEKNHLQATAFLESSKNSFDYDDLNLGTTGREKNQKNKQRYSLLGEHKLEKTLIQHQFIYATENGSNPGPQPFSPTKSIDYKTYAVLGSLGAKTTVAQNLIAGFRTSYLQTNNKTIESSSGKSDYFTSKSVSTGSLEYNFNQHSFELLTDFYYDRFKNLPTIKEINDKHFEHAFLYRTQLTDAESLAAGVRYFPDQNELVKNIMLKQDNQSFILWASYSEGIKIPTFTERFDTAWTVGNPGLDVEKSNQIELGVEKPRASNKDNFWDSTKVKLSGYMVEYKNFIQYSFPAAPFSFQNIQEVEVHGGELSLDWDQSIFHSQLSYNYIDAKDTKTKKEITYIPTHQVFFLVGAQLSFLIAEVQNTYWSSYKTTATKKEENWLATDLIFRTNGLTDWSVQTGIKNIFNNRKSLAEGYPEPGRSYFVFVERMF